MSTNGTDERQLPVDVRGLLPARLFILPLERRIMFPGTLVPFRVNLDDLPKDVANNIQKSDFLGLSLASQEQNGWSVRPIGVAVKVVKVLRLPDGGLNTFLNVMGRMKIVRVIQDFKDALYAEVLHHVQKEPDQKSVDIRAVVREVISSLRSLAEGNEALTEQIKIALANTTDLSRIADFVSSILNIEVSDAQRLLEEDDLYKRMILLLQYLTQEHEMVVAQRRIMREVNEKLEQQQREYFLREQMKAIRHELGMDKDPASLMRTQFEKQLESLTMPAEVQEKIDRDLDRLASLDVHSSEYGVLRSYLEVVLGLPWGLYSKDPQGLGRAERILNKNHFGLEDVKRRILEFLAVRILVPSGTASVICLVGPPGVGKTSLGQSIARALNRKFFRFSVGGLRDESEIRGHRRTYVGALPGKILSGLKQNGTANPVLMIDEIDKMGQSFQGDPASALLEVLDPEQNHAFVDNYVDLPFDLSRILFVVTANTLDSIPHPLLDRMEIIRLSGYLEHEKVLIGQKYLLVKQTKKHGIDPRGMKISGQVFHEMIRSYVPQETGVRNLERAIERICRRVSLGLVQGKDLPKSILSRDLPKWIGPRTDAHDRLSPIKLPGMVYGLAWTMVGGGVLMIEATRSPVGASKGSIKMTGRLGEVMSESVSIAVSVVRGVLASDGGDGSFFGDNIVHLHVPSGAVPKDGPSAGITMAVVFLSLARGKLMPSNFAMTGELSLKGEVLAIGGLREKLVAAQRHGLSNVIIPKGNEHDLAEIPSEVKKGLSIHMAETIDDVFSLMWGDEAKEESFYIYG